MPHDSAPPPCFLALGLERAGDETAVKRAFRRRALQLHPDRGGNDFLAAKINQAKDFLLND